MLLLSSAGSSGTKCTQLAAGPLARRKTFDASYCPMDPACDDLVHDVLQKRTDLN